MMDLFNRLSFDASASFRSSPWLYGLVSGIALGIAGLLITIALFPFFNGGTFGGGIPAPENPVDKSNRLVIMNVLNRFNIEEDAVSPKASSTARLLKRREHIGTALKGFGAVDTRGTIDKARNELISLFKQWDTYLQSGKSSADLKPRFVVLAKTYPWLNTLVWILILNRL